MDAKIFSKKEAIMHGINMAKKYLGVILLMMFIYAVIQIVNGNLQGMAGSEYITQAHIKKLYSQKDAAKNFKTYLKDAGYIDAYGKKQEKLEDLTSPSDMVLPPALEPDREKIFDFLQNYRYRLPFPKAVYYFLMLGLWVLGLLMSIGTTKISLMVSRDQKPEISELFTNVSLLVPYLLSSVCFSLAVIGGMVFLIVPGIILAIALGMNVFFIIDQNMGPIEALNASRTLTKGVRWQLFCFDFLLILLNLAGALCLLVGLFFTIPASSVAVAYVYDKLRQQNEAPAPAVSLT